MLCLQVLRRSAFARTHVAAYTSLNVAPRRTDRVRFSAGFCTSSSDRQQAATSSDRQQAATATSSSGCQQRPPATCTAARFEREQDARRAFWSDAGVWRRAGANTLRCLVGCSIGDLSALALLSAYAPELGTAATVAVSCTSGIGTSLALETAVLRASEGFAWREALRTAFGMSFLSMLSMELAENAVEIGLTGGGAALCGTPAFWWALPPALLAGFLTPLPYNYYMIRRHGKACH